MKNLFKNRYRGSKSLSRNIFKLNALTIAITVCLTSCVALISMNIMVRNIAQNQAISSIKVMEGKLSTEKSDLEIYAKTISTNQKLATAVSEKNTAAILEVAGGLIKTLNVETATITDAKGIVLARTYDPKNLGDDITNQKNVKNALAGTVSSEITTGTAIRYAIKAGAPIYNADNKLIGVVSLGYKLDNARFVDDLKAITGDEFTVFVGDERLNTTLMNNGKRVVGTKLDSKIANIVISQKNQYIGSATILGKNYITMYSPILSDDKSTVTGILFAGRDMTEVEQQLLLNILLIIGISLIAILLSILIGRLTIKSQASR